eukprot:CAMPEP_0119039076 /NCGR_PEP_ID=MMETSP1177-20130426/8382_1 /TAXON_ID=2985 /ORGANISM="Ochromonas sp, Strain CCMP1899" /LENGTH=446 /DNA_ID=CAMNT_0007002507 /DNA_START=140 /DNA_END=1480 /DNA_ORIENTATION=-
MPSSRHSIMMKPLRMALSGSKPNHLRVGIFGGGVVGGGVYELVQKCMESGRFGTIGASIEIAKICVRSLDKARDMKLVEGTVLCTDYADILEDDSINCVVELIGGTDNAKDIIFKAIKKGKHVVTANKALIAAYLPELLVLLEENPSVSFNYEAAVCGGIPIIHSLHSDFLADKITKIRGIMNGTTNYMLCKMEDEGADYCDALKEAQDLGYAEADPTADVEGFDVQAKIALLAKLAFGKTVPFQTVPTAGISKVGAIDFEYARILRSTIKLVGTASLNGDGSLAVFVSPMMVPLGTPLSSAKGPGNMVVVNSDNMNESTFAGPGAGRYPTANSVMNDLIRLSLDKTSPPFPLSSDMKINNDYSAKFYMRITCSDGLGIIGSVGKAAEETGVSIDAVLQNPITNREIVDFVVTTEDVTLSQIQAFADKIAGFSFSINTPFFMPILV